MGATGVIFQGLPWNRSRVTALLILAFLPNVLSMSDRTTPWGSQLYTFRTASFLAVAPLRKRLRNWLE